MQLHAPNLRVYTKNPNYVTLQLPSSPKANIAKFTGQNPKLSNRLFVSGSSNTFCGCTFKPRGLFGDPGLGRSSTTRLLLRRSNFRRSGTLALRERSRGSSRGWTRNSQLRTELRVSWQCPCRRDNSDEHTQV